MTTGDSAGQRKAQQYRPRGRRDTEDALQQEPADDLQRLQTTVGNRGMQQLLSGVRGLLGGGTPLPAALRAESEARFGADFSAVRIHNHAAAHALAQQQRARAFTIGPDIVFNEARYQTGSHESQRLLAHELAHVVQQSRGQVDRLAGPAHEAAADAAARSIVGGAAGPVNAGPAAAVGVQCESLETSKAAEGDPDADISLGILDNPTVGRIAAEALGPTHWAVFREFLRGVQGGMQSATPEQRERIDKKFATFGVSDALKYTAGYGLGIFEGLWISLKGLFEAVITLVKLPYDVTTFLADKVPELAARYGPRLVQLLSEGDGISARIEDVLSRLLKDPMGSLRELDALIDSVKGVALAQVRALGHGAGAKILQLLEEPWFEYGRDIGKIAGQVLFEVILALASDAIANVLKEAAALAARLYARLVEGAVATLSTIKRLLGSALEGLASFGRGLKGALAELFESLKALIARLRAFLTDLAHEPGLVADTGTGLHVPIPETKIPTVLESRALKPPRTSPATVADLTPPKVHPSNVGKGVEIPKTPEASPAKAADAAEAAALRSYGGPGGGHHVPAKSAFSDAARYNLNEALAIPNAELERLGVLHSVVTGAQAKAYRAFAKGGGVLTWEAMTTIETNALVAGGMETDMAMSTVNKAIAALKKAGVAGPTRIPWGG